LTPKYYPFSTKFILTIYFPINLHITHILAGWKKPLQGHPASWKKPGKHLIRVIMYITLLQTCCFLCWQREYQCYIHITEWGKKYACQNKPFLTICWNSLEDNWLAWLYT